MAGRTLEFGLPPPAEATVAWGARAIFKQRGKVIDIVWDRQDAFGSEEWKKDLFRWLDKVGMPALEAEVEDLETDSRRTVTITRGNYTIKASPKGSRGYLYIVAWTRGPKEWMPKRR
jgi:hypothetical protein